jgi:hypothetical protein
MANGWWRGIAALALLTLAGGPGSARAEDERPDLEVEFLGLPLADTDTEVQIQITNISEWWADETSARVATVAPADPPTFVPDTFVENLDPGQSTIITYTLPGPCSGYVIEVIVAPAKNYEGVPESNVPNNRAREQVCPGPPVVLQPQPEPKPGSLGAPINPNSPLGGITRPSPVFNPDALKPEHQRPGTHTYPLYPSAVQSLVRSTSEICGPFAGDPPTGAVGWAQKEGGGGLCIGSGESAEVAQTAVNFDFSLLDQVPNKTLNRAVLRFREEPIRWTSGRGGFEAKGGCVEVLGRATAEWQGRTLRTLFPNERIQAHTPGVQEWYVTEPADFWVANQRPRLGFVLRGGNETPRGDDETSCMSLIDAIELEVTYTVPN